MPAFAIVTERPGEADTVEVRDEHENTVATWVGWNGSYVDMDAWLKACNYVRISFEPSTQTEYVTTFKLAKWKD